MALKNTLLNDATHRHTNNFVTNAFSVMDFHDYKYVGFLSVFRLKTCQIFTLLCSVLSNLQGGRENKKIHSMKLHGFTERNQGTISNQTWLC